MPQGHFRQGHWLTSNHRNPFINTFTYIAANLRQHWRTNLAAAAAVAIATAVLTGALLVGDSVRGSLRDLTLQRLGHIDQAVQTPRLFRQELANELASTAGFADHFTSAQPALLLRGAATARHDSGVRRASDLDLIGIGDSFWQLGRQDPRPSSSSSESSPDAPPDGVWLTQQVAGDLQATAGDTLLLRLPVRSDVPADSPLGEKADTVVGKQFVVAGVLPDHGLARFGLRPSQRPPRAIFVPLGELATAIDEPGKANTLLVASESVDRPADSSASNWLTEHFRPQLADYGVTVKPLSVGDDFQYVQVASDGLVLPEPLVDAAAQAFRNVTPQPVTTYLANTIQRGDQAIAYSTVTGVDSTSELGPLLDANGQPVVLDANQVALNRWAAERLEASVGDTVTVRYYQPESTHGELTEAEPLQLTVAAVVDLQTGDLQTGDLLTGDLQTGDGQPTRAADPDLSPQLPGVTDQQSIADWDLPFDLVEPITQADEDYWDEYKTTPKAFVPYSLAAKLWGTRWGEVSLLRLPMDKDHTAETYSAALRRAINPADLGFAFLPVKQQGLDAASGTTPFDGLFLGFSMFLIASAIMLLVLLFRLAVENRASEIGLLSAIGFTHARAKQLLSGEVLAIAVIGAIAGVLLGIGYAWLMIAGLKTLWVAAIAAPFLDLHIGRWSLPIGFAVGVLVAYFAARRILRSIIAQPPTRLLQGNVAETTGSAQSVRRIGNVRRLVPVVCIAGAVALGYFGATQRGEAQAGAFFGAGAFTLTALLMWLKQYLSSRATQRSSTPTLSLAQLAWANLARQAGRSTLTVGLVAAASFLLLAISAFRLAPSEQGTGGYDWIGQSDMPLHYDLNTPDGRLELGFRDSEEQQLATATIESLRIHGGEDASCLNLYRTAQPRVVGVRNPSQVLAKFGWAGKVGDDAVPNLDANLGNDSAGRSIVPVVLDFNTAMYSLHLSGSVDDRLTIRDEDDQPVTLQVVGLLKNSMLQGDLLVSDRNFRKLFPTDSGSQLFLLRAPQASDAPAGGDAGSGQSLDAMLEQRLSDYGFAVTSARSRLDSFLAVQNTYLSTFQSLGGLGLLLGTLGLAVVQLRSVIQRQGEIALLQAVGFRRSRVVLLVLLENLALLVLGLLLGGIAAAVALAPQLGVQDASLPWATIAWLLTTIVVVDIAATWLATRGTLRRPVLATLRGD